MTRLGCAASVIAMLGACSPHAVNRTPAPPIATPAAYGIAAVDQRPLPEQWWRGFGAPQLDNLVAQTLAKNLELRAAWARVRQARFLATQQGAARWPSVDLQASAARQKNRFDLGDTVFTPTVDTFTVSASAAYEVDVWRRIANQSNAAAFDALAARDNAEALAMTLTAEVTEAWLDLVSQKAQKRLLSQQIELNDTYLELVKLRFQQGLASALDVYQQQQQAIATRANLTLIDAAIVLQQNRIAVLVGKPPAGLELSAPDALPTLPALPATGLPADLVGRRPDVRAAMRQVVAADYRVAVAVADRLPGLRLSGSLSLQSRELGEIIATPLWSVVSSIFAPLFDGGRRAAEVDRSEAVVDERLMTYGQTLLRAIVEVENALVQERQQLAYLSELEARLAILESTLREARGRYRQGLIDYLPVLSALQAQQQAELALLQAQRQLLSYRVQLCRALGGTWTRQLSAAKRGGSST